MKPFFTLLVCCLFPLLSAEESFIAIDGKTNAILHELGPDIDQRYSPCSSFKITLSLIGYDKGILKDENTPVWEFQEGYDDWLEVWKQPQTPSSWMHTSCLWYSKLLALDIGLDDLENALIAFDYGNRDVSGILAPPGPTSPLWVNSSLLISPREQTHFIRKLVFNELPIASRATQMTKNILFKEELPNGWRLFGKTGWSGSDIAKEKNILEHAWFVGWIEREQHFVLFAYLIRSSTIPLNERIPRVKQLLSHILTQTPRH